MSDNPISGLFSGLDTSSIISKLIAIEKKPLYALQRKKTAYEKQISSYGDLLSKLSGLKDSLSFFQTNSSIPITALSSNPAMLSVNVSKEAAIGSYDIEIKQLASAHRIISSSGVQSETTSIFSGTGGFFSFKVGENGQVYEINLTDGMTLIDLRDEINGKNAGVRANIINTGLGENPYKLVLSSSITGAQKNIIITQDDTTFGGNYNNIQEPKNAIFKINGVELERNTNTISDAIEGLTLTLNKADLNYGTPNATNISVTVSQDIAIIRNKLNILVAQYNGFVSVAKTLSAKGQVLANDSTIDNIINALRKVTTNRYNDNILVNIGLTHDRSGVLQVNDSILSSELSKNPKEVMETLKSMAESFDSTLSSIINNLIPSKKDGLSESVKRVEKSMSSLDLRITKKEETLKKQFAKLEQTINIMQSRGDYLVQQLSKLSNRK